MTAIPAGTALPFEFGPFRADPARRELRRGSEVVSLTPRVFDTLMALIERRHRVAGKAELMAALWPDRAVEEANLTQNVFVLRKALREREDGCRYIATLPRRGYRFVGDVREVEEERLPALPAAAAPAAHERKLSRRLLAALALATALATAAAAPLRSQASGPASPAPREGHPVRPARVRVIVLIQDARTETPVWSRSYEGRPAELQHGLPAEIAGSLGTGLERAATP
jgi:DNA-binding winged helix-turn-helix (wHTH) protein